jgi:hypothetical protein
VAASVGVVITQATFSAAKNGSLHPVGGSKYKYLALTVALHLMQPVARLYGRIRHGLTPWRRRGGNRSFLFTLRPGRFTHWSEQWRPAEDWLSDLEKGLVARKTRVSGAVISMPGTCRSRTACSPKAGACWPLRSTARASSCCGCGAGATRTQGRLLATALLAALSLGSALDAQWLVSGVTTALLLAVGVAFAREKAGCLSTVQATFGGLGTDAGAAPAGEPESRPTAAGASGKTTRKNSSRWKGTCGLPSNPVLCRSPW